MSDKCKHGIRDVETNLPYCRRCDDEAKSELAAPTGSALTDAQKIQKAIQLLERLERECLVPDFAHDAMGSCPVCRLLKQLKAPNDRTERRHE